MIDIPSSSNHVFKAPGIQTPLQRSYNNAPSISPRLCLIRQRNHGNSHNPVISLIGISFDYSPLRQVVLALHAHTFGQSYSTFT